MADLDPAHVEAVARAIDPIPFVNESKRHNWEHYRGLARSHAIDLLTSTDPAVHVALLAALVRAGVLDCEASGGPVGPEGKRRYVTDWEETCD